MSGYRPRRCSAGGLHRYKRFLTNNEKPIWRCVDCPSGFNYLVAMIGSRARCFVCKREFPLIEMDLESGPTPYLGAPIVCDRAGCEENAVAAVREKVGGEIIDRLAARAAEIQARGKKFTPFESRSDSEQDTPSIAKLIEEDKS